MYFFVHNLRFIGLENKQGEGEAQFRAKCEKEKVGPSRGRGALVYARVGIHRHLSGLGA